MRKRQRRSLRLPGYSYAQPGAYFITVCAHKQRPLFGDIRNGQMYPNTFGHIVWEEWKRTAEIREEVVLDAFVVMPNHIHGLIVIRPPGVPDEVALDVRGYRAGRLVGGVRMRNGREATNGSPVAESFGARIAMGNKAESSAELFRSGVAMGNKARPSAESFEDASRLQNVQNAAGATRRSRLPKGPEPRSLGAIMAGFKAACTTRINRMRQTPGKPVWHRNYWEHVVRDERMWRNVRRYIINNPKKWDEKRYQG